MSLPDLPIFGFPASRSSQRREENTGVPPEDASSPTTKDELETPALSSPELRRRNKTAAIPPQPDVPSTTEHVETYRLNPSEPQPHTNNSPEQKANPNSIFSTTGDLELSVDQLFGPETLNFVPSIKPWEPFPTVWPEDSPRPSYPTTVQLNIHTANGDEETSEGTLYWIGEEEYAGLFYQRFRKIPDNDPPLINAKPWIMYPADHRTLPTWVGENLLASRLWDWPVNEGEEKLPRSFVAVTKCKQIFGAMANLDMETMEETMELGMLSRKSIPQASMTVT